MNATTLTFPTQDDGMVLDTRAWSWLLKIQPSSLLLAFTIGFLILEILFSQATKVLALLDEMKAGLERLNQLADQEEDIRNQFKDIKTQNEELKNELERMKEEVGEDTKELRQEMEELKERNEEDQQHIIHETAKMMVESEKQLEVFRGKMDDIREMVLGVKRDFEAFACKETEEKITVLDAAEEVLQKMQDIVEASIERKAQKGLGEIPGGWI